MKKILVLAMSVLAGTLAFATGTEGPSGNSSVAVLNASGSNMFKVLYKAKSLGNVKVTIRNENREVLFSELLKNKDGFMRPYNFDGLLPGSYTIEVEDESGTQIERVNYGMTEPQPFIHLTRLPQPDKYLLSGHFLNEENIQVRIYDGDSELVFDESRKVAGQFGEVYNLKNLPGRFTLEVSDQHGLLKSIQY